MEFGTLTFHRWAVMFRQTASQPGLNWLLALALVATTAIESAAQPPRKAGPRKADPAERPEAAEVADTASDEDESEPVDLPTIDKLEVPEFEPLMRGPPVDWVVMTNKQVLFVEPVHPRPGTLDDLHQKTARLMRKASDPPETAAARDRRLASYFLPLTLIEGEERDYRLHVRYIKEIIYFEDLMLRRIDMLLDERRVRPAYELLVALERRQADWPGIAARKERVTFTEATVQLAAGQAEQALALLESLHERDHAYPGLDEQLGLASDRLMSQALAANDPRQTRYFLRRLAKRLPTHRQVGQWTNRLIEQAREELARATAADRQGDLMAALDFAEQAVRIWPSLPEALGAYNRLSTQHQRLRVGVLELPSPQTEPQAVILSASERRKREMTQPALFFPARFDDKVARYETRLFSDWNPIDLGHRLILKLRSYPLPGDSHPPLTASGLALAMSERVAPGSSQYDARFAAFVEGLSLAGPFELAVDFRQVPLRPEVLFSLPYRKPALEVSPATDAQAAPTVRGPEARADEYPFQLRTLDAGRRAIYARSVAEPEKSSDRRVAEVVELCYESHEKAIQGLLRGEVSLLPYVPQSAVRNFAQRTEFFSQTFGLPLTHFLQFHPRSRHFASRALRRALIYALDRRTLLEELFLNEPAGALGRLTSAPWPTTSYAYNRFVEPHPYDAPLAYSLARTAEKELGGKLPVLRLVAPADPEALQAATKIVAAWDQIGVPTVLVPLPTGASSPGTDEAPWDVAYRIERICEPLVDLWTLLALTHTTETTDLRHLPTWLRHDLLELDRVGDWRSAESLLHKLHRQFAAEVHLIPLWEVEQFMVYRRTIRNVPDRPLQTYQSIERWKVEPWFTRD
ncbi:MAG: ABC transporter substrate-binding protein [Planctomycetaceae bacterium]